MDRRGAAPPVAVGRYAMLGQIGSGGMATVHLGRGPAGEIVAIKRLKPHLVLEPDVVKSFLDEARLSACVRHPNVVSTLDVVTHDDEVFLVMEYVEGVSLAALLRGGEAGDTLRAVQVPVARAVAIAAEVLLGLHAAHEALSETGEPLHIVHRDVSPHNVLVGADGRARVLDFGVAKALGRLQTTRDGKIKGKLGYMAPEQLSGRGVTRRTDIFAAGIVLWELLTGERLFHTDDEATTVTRVLMERVRPPSALRPEVPAALDRIVLRALERDPSKRFLAADDVARALREAVQPADASDLGAWVRSAAGEELARRSLLLRAGAPAVRDLARPRGTSPDDTGSSTLSAPVPAASPSDPVRKPRRTRVLAVALALVALLTGWGALSSSRAKATHLEPSSSSPPQPSAVESASAAAAAVSPPAAPSPAPATTAAPVAPSVEPSSNKTPPRRATPRSSPRGAPSARERLYSRD